MSTTTGAATGGAVGPAEPLRPLDARKLRMYRGGFGLFILAESLGFLTLFSVRFLVAGAGHPAELDATLGTLITLLFAVSAAGAVVALRAARRGETERLVSSLTWAAGLGLGALFFVVVDWGRSATILDPASRFGGAYLATTLFHAIHIVAGVVFLAALRSSARRGRFSPANHWLVEAGVRFWLFVSAAWAALYVVFFWL